MSGSELVSLVVGFVTVSAIAFVVICLVASFLRFQGMAEDVHTAAVEGQVGLDGWSTALAARLSMVPSAPKPFSVVQLVPRGDAAAESDLKEDAEALRRALRPRDRVFLLEGGRIGILLAAPRERLRVVLERLRTVAPLNRPSGWAIGAATYPEDGTRVDPLIQASDGAIENSLSDEAALFVLAGASAEELPAAVNDELEPPSGSELVDPLTGALKPERFLSSLNKLVAGARGGEHSISLLVIRIEHLDRFREHYSGAAVDALLSGLGALLRTNVREEDLPVRIDEEQMGVMLHCDGAAAEHVAQRLIDEVRSRPVTYESGELKMAIQIGIAAAPADARTGRDLFACSVRAVSETVGRGRGAFARYDAERMTPGDAQPEEAAPQEY